MSATKTTIMQSGFIMFRVIFALILREAKNRYGHLKISYVWSLLEPVLAISVLMLVLTYRGRFSPDGMSQILFFATGFLPFYLFRDVASRTMTAIRPNFQLLTYPQVQVIDLFVARALLEVFIFFIVFTVFMTIIAFTRIEPVAIENILQLLVAVLLIATFGFAVGISAGALIPLFPSVEYLIRSFIILPMFFTSGTFFIPEMLPADVRDIALINPLLNLTTYFRAGFFTSYESEHDDLFYASVFILINLLYGLLLQRALRRYAYQI